MKLINKIKQQFDLSELKGDPLEDVARILLFAVICFGLGIIVLVINGLIWLM
jgi:hypothetical protein